MVDFTLNEWAILGLVLILGWLLGLMSRRNASHWRKVYEEERDLRKKLQTDYDARRQDFETRIAASNERIAELERERDTRSPISAGTAGTIGAAARGDRDDLTQITGVDREGEVRLNEIGIHSYRDIARMSDSEVAATEARLGMEPGYMERSRWREQADLLEHGRAGEHREKFRR